MCKVLLFYATMDSRQQSSVSSQFNPDRLSESDIDQIWKNMMKSSKRNKPSSTSKSKIAGSSVDTTPTTDYGEGLFPLHPETLEEELEQDKQISQMNSVLKAKKLQPKSYLSQVILYDNVSHDRLLAMRLADIRHAHKLAEARAKRRHETFVRSLERKQNEWGRRDKKTIAKLEPENLSEFNFTFGRLYNKPDYPYQAVVQSLNNVQPPARTLDHARRRPTLLPQVTNKPIYDDEETIEDKTFITKLPKLRDQLPPLLHHNESTITESIDKPASKHFASLPSAIREDGLNRRGRRRNGKARRMKDWMNDARFHTLTNLLGERYSPKPVMQPSQQISDQVTVLSSII